MESKKITPDAVIMVSSGLSVLHFKFIIRGPSYKLEVWSLKEVSIYQSGSV